MSRQYHECLHPVGNHGSPPPAFLDVIVDTIKTLPDEVFAPNASKGDKDIYNLLLPVLGPWEGLLYRKAVMCECLRSAAAWESGWNWNEGRDTTAGPETPWEEETGAFQVSANSMAFDPSLRACVDSRFVGGNATAQQFIHIMKLSHPTAVEYCARLFRFNTRWSGPANTGHLAGSVWKPSVAEFQGFLS